MSEFIGLMLFFAGFFVGIVSVYLMLWAFEEE